MKWVGIRLEDRSLVATPILMATGNLKKKIKFIERDSACAQPVRMVSSSASNTRGAGVSDWEFDGAKAGPLART